MTNEELATIVEAQSRRLDEQSQQIAEQAGRAEELLDRLKVYSPGTAQSTTAQSTTAPSTTALSSTAATQPTAAQSATPAAGAESSTPSDITTRRGLMKKGAAAVGIGLAGAAVTASPAAAAGEHPLLGTTISTDGTTDVRYSGAAAGTNLFTVQDSAFGTALTPAAIGAWASGTGVHNGLYAYSQSRDNASANTGHGIVSYATSAARSHLYMRPAGPDPRTDTYSHGRGEFRSTSGRLFFCTGSGTPGTWVELSRTGPTLLDPSERAFDSRVGKAPVSEAPADKRIFAGGEIRTVDLNAETSVPTQARSVLLNATVANTGTSGFITLFNADNATVPTASTLNWFQPNSIVANSTVVACNANQEIKVYASDGCNVILDILAWYP